MASYGIPYMGSKDKLIHKIATLFPKADNFYDLFGGGFSVSHFMLYHHAAKYKRFFYNEIKADLVQFVRDAIAGKYNYDVFKPKWVSKEDFEKNKKTCAYIRIIWSFANNQQGYIFGPENETIKKSLHNAVVFNEFDALAIKHLRINSFPVHLSIRGRRLLCRSLIIQRKKGEIQQLQQLEQLDERLEQLERLERLQQLQQLLQLEQLERLERLERLEQLQQLLQLLQLELSSKSYDEVQILPNSIVYCDPPYKGTSGYITSFDHERFWEWVRKQSEPVFVSEYQAPPGIKTIMALNHKKSNSSSKQTDSVEKVFGNKAAYRLFERGKQTWLEPDARDSK